MSSTLYSSTARWIVVALGLGFATSHAMAQGQFSGAWRVAKAETPNWIEPTSPPPVHPAEIGTIVRFGASDVSGDSPFSCKEADLKILTVAAADYFGGGMSNSTDASKTVSELGLAGSAKTLRVDCEAGVFDYYEGNGNLVIAHDNMVYTLEKVR